MVDTSGLALSGRSATLLGRRLPALRPSKLALYVTELASGLLGRGPAFGRQRLSYYLLITDHRLRRAILRSDVPLDEFDLVICEYASDAEVLTTASSARTLYDCPTPRADEEYYEGNLTQRQHQKLRRREAALFESVDHLSFHWESYARYAVEHYGISGRNLLNLNCGCTPGEDRPRFDDPPRVVYLGYLGMRFINLPLLARLTELYPHIDVYGTPPPTPDSA